MHAYLLVGGSTQTVAKKVQELAQSLKATIIPQEFKSIAHVRELTKIAMLSKPTPTIYLLENIDSTTHEALNAFLKTLEEPRENTYFLLTASTLHTIIPTIVSRCLIVKLTNDSYEIADTQKEFTNKVLQKDIDWLFQKTLEFKDRDEVIIFLKGVVYALSEKLLENGSIKQKIADTIEIVMGCISALSKNGNVKLQTTTMILRLAETT